MTDKVYWREMYRKEIEAEVVMSDISGIVLDRTVFYPTGGGQPNDTGTIDSDGVSIRIADVSKKGEDVLHIPSNREIIDKGTKVIARIDWGRRYAHMRYHSAIHVLDGIVSTRHESEALLTGSQIYQDHCRVDMNMEEFSREKVEQIIDQCNAFMGESHEIYQKVISREEALAIPNLSRTGPGKELIKSLDEVRVIVIEGLDEQADGGTHVRNTTEIGRINLMGIQSKGKRNKRIEFSIS